MLRRRSCRALSNALSKSCSVRSLVVAAASAAFILSDLRALTAVLRLVIDFFVCLQAVPIRPVYSFQSSSSFSMSAWFFIDLSSVIFCVICPHVSNVGRACKGQRSSGIIVTFAFSYFSQSALSLSLNFFVVI